MARLSTALRARLRAAVRDALATDAGSVFAVDEAMDAVSARVAERPRSHRRRALGLRRAGTLDRRQFLKLLGLGTGAAVTAGGGAVLGARVFGPGRGVAAAQSGTERYGITFDRVLDAVADLGLDDGGGERVNAQLEDALEDGTLIEFPSGRYRMDRLVLDGMRRVGLVAAGDVTVEPAYEGSQPMVLGRDVRDVVVDGFHMDYSDAARGGSFQLRGTGGHLVLRGITQDGRVAPDSNGYRVEQRARDGTALVEDVEATSYYGRERQGMGFNVGLWHAGEITIRNAHIEGFGNNGLYASGPGGDHPEAGHGTVTVEGGLFRNNNIAGVRLGTRGSSVRRATVVVDGDVPGQSEGKVNARGIRFRDQQDILAADCDLIHTSAGGGGAIVFEGAAGAGTVRNTRIRVTSTDYRAPVLCKIPGHDGAIAPTFEQVSITGRAQEYGIMIIERPGTVVRDCCIQLEQGSGIGFVRSPDGTVDGCSIDVPGAAIATEGSGSWTGSGNDTAYGGTCPVPDREPSTGPRGGGDGGTRDGPDGTVLTLSGGGPGDRQHYLFRVNGEAEQIDAYDATVDGTDHVFGTTVVGRTAGGQDSFRVTGGITEFHADPGITVMVDGQAMDRAAFLEQVVNACE